MIIHRDAFMIPFAYMLRVDDITSMTINKIRMICQFQDLLHGFSYGQFFSGRHDDGSVYMISLDISDICNFDQGDFFSAIRNDHYTFIAVSGSIQGYTESIDVHSESL